MPGRHRTAPSPARRAVTDLARLLLPVQCAGCGRLDVPFCRGCLAALTGPGVVVRDVAGVPVVAVVRYAGPARRLLPAWKDDGRHDVSPLVSAALARSLRTALSLHTGSALTGTVVPQRVSAVLVVPVPSSAAARRRRGGDVLAEATRQAVVRLRDPRLRVVAPLRQRLRVADQAGLDVDARRRNRAGALVVRGGSAARDLAGRDVVLVDDVLTTGATLADAVRALRSAGARPVAAAVVAVTPRRSTHRPGSVTQA